MKRTGSFGHPQGVRDPRRFLALAWASPATLLGLTIALLALASRGAVRRREGAIEVWGGIPRRMLESLVPIRGGADALTLGHVIVGRRAASLLRHAAHERVHVRQYERWGPFFLPAYACSSLWAWARGRDPYRDNRFERAALDQG
jgi:hypothetical protein